MPKLCANLHYLFQELPFLDRFAAAAACGFRAVECLYPYEAPAEAIGERLGRHGLTLALFNLPSGDREKSERGLAALPGREADFRADLERAFDYARVTGGRRLHVLSGLWPSDRDKAEGERVLIGNLRDAAELAAAQGLELLIEPINPRDIPGYFLNTPQQAAAILAQVAHPNVRLQLDLYHCQIVAGDLATHIRRLLPLVAHIQIAGVPERHEPDRGEVNFAYLLGLLDELGYDGWVGCEYRPASGTRAGLGWARPWGIEASA
ncbi:MAG TPA: 2-oxo-tetronate isomerase [Stellaceae bacterium]|jgi:hydroxypyruvate isomerase|nr:2-oxo-tetronate isomerase [Stellaceae bacterium]